MSSDPIPGLMIQINPQRMSADLFALTVDPLPFRRLNYTLPGHSKSTLDEADDLIQAALEASGYCVEREPVRVQAYRCDATKPKSQQYSPPMPEDPWYTAHNLYAEKQGAELPDEIIVVISHKDSQSWVNSPGANDNAVGTVASVELARVLGEYSSRRTIRFIYCNEEHTPWTSVAAANNARERGDAIIAVFNLDGLGGKAAADREAGRMTNVTLYTTPEGELLADLMAQVNEEYSLGLTQIKYRRASPGDDDGSFVNAGFAAAVANTGSYPYAEPNYHEETDGFKAVDIENAALTTRATLAALVRLDRA